MAQREDLDWAIKVENVSKTFKLPHEKHTSVKSIFINGFKRKSFELQKAVDDVSFEVKRGEFFGIVGRNGSGKSTLLKCIAGVYQPTDGKIKINGSLVPFIELGVGFNPELTGRDNVFLNGALLGFSRPEMEAMYDEIVEFAELENFMDQKLKNYSSGMQVRLAFSIAIRADSEIILLDEVLAVGDGAFQKKCYDYFKEIKEQETTVVLVSHDMAVIEKFCTKAVIIDSGKVVYSGDPLLVSAEYKLSTSTSVKKIIKKPSQDPRPSYDKSIRAVSINGENKTKLHTGEGLTISIEVVPTRSMHLIAGISVHKNDGTFVAFDSTKKQLETIKTKKGELYKYEFKMEQIQLLPGSYRIDAALYDSDYAYVDLKLNACKLVIMGKDDSKAGLVNLDGDWVLKKN